MKSVFIAEYTASEALRREIHEGLQVVENWNSANADLFYGSAGTLKGKDRESQEVSMLALHLLQSALVFINTLLVQSVLRDPGWAVSRSTCTGTSISDWLPELGRGLRTAFRSPR